MVIRFLLIFVCFLCLSCINTKLLSDGYTRVVTNKNLYKNHRFDQRVLEIIDTSKFYVEQFHTFNGRKETQRSLISVLRFYPNGLFNMFVIHKNPLGEYDLDNLDFIKTGYRGYYYYKKGNIYIVTFASVDEFYNIGKVKAKIIKDDTNLIKWQYCSDKKVIYYYEKKAISRDLKSKIPNANWK